MTEPDPILTLLLKHGPKSSFEIREVLVSDYNLSSEAVSKRLERLVKNGKIARYLRLEKQGYIYYLPEKHSEELLQKTARGILQKYRRLLGRVFEILIKSKVLSIFELGRLANVSFYTKTGTINRRIASIINDLEKLGAHSHINFLVLPELPVDSKSTELIANYEASLYEEAALLHFTKQLFLSKRRAEEMTVYRTPKPSSLVGKFDLIGHGGWKRRIKILLECNLRRDVTLADLVGYHQRVGGTYRKSYKKQTSSPMPIAYYYLGNQFSDEAIAFAFDKRIRLLSLEGVLSRNLMELQPVEGFRKRKPKLPGRFAEIKGIALEAIVGEVYRKEGFKTELRKVFSLRDGQLTQGKDVWAKRLTDVDVFATRNGEVCLIECKGSKERLTRKELFGKLKKYSRIAEFIKKEKEDNSVLTVIIARLDEVDIKEARRKFGIPLVFITPSEFYEQKRESLEGMPKWLFGF